MRAHFSAPAQSSAGALQANVMVAVYQNGTTEGGSQAGAYISGTVWADASTQDQLGNPFTSSAGDISFYLDYPQRVDLGLSVPGFAPVYYPDVDPSRAGFNVVSVTAGYSISPSDQVIEANAAGNSVTLLLPPAAAGLDYIVVRTDSSAGTVTLQAASGQFISGSASTPVSPLSGIRVISDGLAWYVIPAQGAPTGGAVVSPANGGTGVSAASTALAGAALGSSSVVNVKAPAYGAKGDGSTDDTLAIKAAVTAAGSSGTVFFPAGTYMVSALTEFPPGVRFAGGGRSGLSVSSQAVVRASAAMAAVFASSGWTEGTNTATHTGVAFQSLKVDGNNLATHGVVSQNYDSSFTDLEFANVSGDCLRFDAFSQSGSVQIASTGVNNRVAGCTFQNCGRGLATNDVTSGTAVYTDGFARDNIVAGATSAGIAVGRASGWLISGNHLYSLSQHGIQAGQMAATRITDNYIETWGTTATAGTYRAIDAATIQQSDSGNGIVIKGNTLRMAAAPGNAASVIEGISVLCANTNSTNVAATGNILRCAPSSGFASATGCRYANVGSGSVLTVASTGNLLTGSWTTGIGQTPAGGTITITAGS